MYQGTLFLRLHFLCDLKICIRYFKRYKYNFKNTKLWMFISLYKPLSENFIREFQDKLD